jgi:phosphoglycolate phosphatase-like HAD superfamily hydrolase
MEAALRAAPRRSPALAGAADMLSALGAKPDVTLALASGAYERSVLAKLRAAGLELDALARATGSDAVAREEIVTMAVARATARAARPFDRRVSVGDGPWDVHTARRLELAFVGVASGPGEARLRAAGATTVVGDYRDLAAFLVAVLR